MKKYTPQNPVFSDEFNIIERADLVNAQMHNASVQQVMDNTVALKNCIGNIEGSKLKFADGIESDNMVDAVNEVFQVGNEKKKKLVENLVARGVPASTSDTWESLIGKVSKMSDISKDTVTAAVLLSGYTAHDAAGVKITGNLADKTGTTDYSAEASLDATNSRVKLKVPAAGKYGTGNYLYAAYNTIAALIGLTAAKVVKGNTILGIKGNDNNMDTSGGTAAAGDILSGKKAAVKGILVTGTMTNRGAWTGSTRDSSNVTIPAGYHDGKGYVSGAGAYNKGVSDADTRTNADSANYKSGYSAGDSAGYNRGHSEGYNSGVNDADSRVNTSSASYGSGYSAGVSSMDGTINNLNGQIAQKDQMIADLINQSAKSINPFIIRASDMGWGDDTLKPCRYENNGDTIIPFTIGKNYVIVITRKKEEEMSDINKHKIIDGLEVSMFVSMQQTYVQSDGHQMMTTAFAGKATKNTVSLITGGDLGGHGFIVEL